MHTIVYDAAVLALSWWFSFRSTPDLDGNPRAVEYRVALMAFYLAGATWLLRQVGAV